MAPHQSHDSRHLAEQASKEMDRIHLLQSDNKGLNGDITRRALDPKMMSRLVAQLVHMLGEREGNVPSATLLDEEKRPPNEPEKTEEKRSGFD
jgi:hypothetical protein